MVIRDSRLRAALASVICWAWQNKTHRILLYISFVVTLSLVVSLFDVSLVGR
jgi:hypothetical protein